MVDDGREAAWSDLVTNVDRNDLRQLRVSGTKVELGVDIHLSQSSTFSSHRKS